MRRRRLVGAVVALVLAAATAGCQGDPDEPEHDPAAATALLAAIDKLAGTTARVSLRPNGAATFEGVIDPPGRRSAVRLDLAAGQLSMRVDLVRIGPDQWLRGDATGAGDRWLHVDAARLPPGSPYQVLPSDDPTGVGRLGRAANRVVRDGDRGFRGTIDYTKVGTVPPATLDQYGDKARAVPFTATVDEQGRLTSFTVDAASAGLVALGQVTAVYSEFGLPVTVSPPPPAEVVEAPEQIYTQGG